MSTLKILKTKREIQIRDWPEHGIAKTTFTVPKGTRVSNHTAAGPGQDPDGYFVLDYKTIVPEYFHFDAEHRGIRIAAEDCEAL